MNGMIFEGRVEWFNAAKGYGFITYVPKEGDDKRDIFVHFSSIETNGYKKLDKDDMVSFEVGSRNGKPQAINVKVVQSAGSN